MRLRGGRLSPLVRRLAHLTSMSALLARRQGQPRILMLHAVGSERQAPLYPYLLNLYPTRVFQAELRYLARHFSVVPLDRIVERVRHGDGRTCHEVALTFDD